MEDSYQIHDILRLIHFIQIDYAGGVDYRQIVVFFDQIRQTLHESETDYMYRYERGYRKV